MNEKTQIITNDIIQSLDALYNLCSDMSERIGAAQNQNVDAGNEDMALLSDNLARLQGEVSAFRKQLADSHQDWEQIKSQLLKRTEDNTMKAFVQIKVETHKLLSLQEQFQQELRRKVETHKLLSLQEQFQQELRRLKNLKATHRHIFICRASWSMLYQVSVVAVILSLLALNAWQFKRNRSMSDNDLKYRTILMMGGAQTQDIDTLETIFEYSRDRKRIRALRLQVQDYEYRVKLRAQKLEQMRRLGEEIEGLE